MELRDRQRSVQMGLQLTKGTRTCAFEASRIPVERKVSLSVVVVVWDVCLNPW